MLGKLLPAGHAGLLRPERSAYMHVSGGAVHVKAVQMRYSGIEALSARAGGHNTGIAVSPR